MKNNNLSVIILAAGKGTRMNSELPKVLHEINGNPMIVDVVNTSKKLNPNKIIIIVGYKKELVIKTLKNSELTFIEQKEQKGTGHAVMQCNNELSDFDGNLLILSGDVPLISIDTLNKFIKLHKKNQSKASLISTVIDNPSGYGRIIRNNKNNFSKIIEHKDAKETQLEIKEINSGIYIFDSKTLFEKINFIKNNNKQNEYYLTDIFNFIKPHEISILITEKSREISGVNTIEQLMELSE